MVSVGDAWVAELPCHRIDDLIESSLADDGVLEIGCAASQRPCAELCSSPPFAAAHLMMRMPC